jgi:hypothetical protein
MMARTHRAWSGVFWLGTTLAINELGRQAGAQDWLIHPAVIVAGFFIAPWFSAGRYLSPDIDHRWAPGPPRHNYDWRFHRGFTHRIWFASLLSIIFGFTPYLVLLHAGIPGQLSCVVLAPVNGWWSHLAGDMIYGRIKIGNLVCDRRRIKGPFGSVSYAYRWHWWHVNVGLGWTTGGLSETGRPSSGGSALIVDPASKVCVGLATALTGLHLVLLVGG